MNKKELIEAVAGETGVTVAATTNVVNTVLNTIQAQLTEGQKVQLTGFGTFEAVKRNARNGINPQTGESIKIAARTSPKFTPGKSLKDIVNGSRR